MARRLRNFGIGLLMALGMVGFTAVPASAGTGACPVSYNCVWNLRDYDGATAQILNSNTNWNWNMSDGNAANNRVESISANHASACRSFFYRDAGYSGQYIYFYQQGAGVSRDPYLQNGGGAGPYSDLNFANDIQSNQYVSSGC